MRFQNTDDKNFNWPLDEVLTLTWKGLKWNWIGAPAPSLSCISVMNRKCVQPHRGLPFSMQSVWTVVYISADFPERSRQTIQKWHQHLRVPYREILYGYIGDYILCVLITFPYFQHRKPLWLSAGRSTSTGSPWWVCGYWHDAFKHKAKALLIYIIWHRTRLKPFYIVFYIKSIRYGHSRCLLVIDLYSDI